MDTTGIVGYLASVSVRSLVLFAVAAAVLAAFRVQAAAARHAVWTVVAGGMLLLAALAPALPPLPVHLLKPAATSIAQLPYLPAAQVETGGPIAPTPQPAAPRFTWQEIAIAGYAAVALILLGRLAFSYLFTRRLVRAATPIRRFDDTYASNWISVPMTVGRRILLPAGWETWEEPKLQAVLAHERTHVRRADWAIALLSGANRCIFWFHPLAWWLERHLATLAEQACDDSALLLVESEHYAQALLEMAAAVKTAQGRLIWEAMAMAKTAEIRMRIDRILDETRQIPRAMSRARWLAVLALGLPCIWLCAVTQVVPAAAQEAPKDSAAMSEFLKGRRQLSPSDANVMEQYLTTHPQDLDVRSQLIFYYYSVGTREPRLSHIQWLIANHPEASVTAFASSGVLPHDNSLNSAADYQRVAAAWKQAVASNSNSPSTLGNAAQFFQSTGDLETAEAALNQAMALQGGGNVMWKDRLGKLYALAILESTGEPKFPASQPSFSMRVRSQLPSSEDGNLLFATGSALTAAAREPKPGQTLPPGVLNLNDYPLIRPAIELGQQLMERAGQFGGPRAVVAQVIPGSPYVVGGGVQAPVRGGVIGGIIGSAPTPNVAPQTPAVPPPPILKKVEPEYPPLARQARISGVVKLAATIAPDGTMQHLEVISGHPLLVPAALQAVKDWVFQGSGSPVKTVLDVQFILPPGDTPPPASEQYGKMARIEGAPMPPKIRIGGNVQASKLIQKVDPVYPQAARADGVEGSVTLRVTISESGEVETAEPVEGNPVLATAAQDAVRQWRYQPTLLNGNPVKVETTVVIPFQLR